VVVADAAVDVVVADVVVADVVVADAEDNN
jgi:hypothetical protein